MDRLVRAFIALQVDAFRPQLEQRLREARARVEADPKLTPAQKQQYLARMTEHPAIVAARSVPEADKEVAAQLRPQIEEMMRETRGEPPAGSPAQPTPPTQAH
jgi:hypothetical protein